MSSSRIGDETTDDRNDHSGLSGLAAGKLTGQANSPAGDSSRPAGTPGLRLTKCLACGWSPLAMLINWN